ncbi:MAG TPA: DUF1521 domain-containing protein [Pyrinomonadaceae bacterium]|jgi:hypothetical protein
MGDVNFNIFNFNAGGAEPNFFQNLNPVAFQDINGILSDIFEDFANLFDAFGGNQFNSGDQQGIWAGGGGCIPPSPDDSTHPSGSLKTDAGVITTPGGYKIEATGQFEWTITGPDGKSTRVWGDPHVAEGDGGKWDFKRNSTFVLGDGTRINVSTAPWGNGGMTVTSGLEIISGNDRVTVSGIDKGKGVVGEVTQDGYAHANTFGGNDVFVMGSETDDWSYQGKEIIGSENGGDSFKLGNDLAAGNTRPFSGYDTVDWMQLVRDLGGDMSNNWNDFWRPNELGSNPYYDGVSNRDDVRADQRYDRGRHRNQMAQAFRLLGQMFNVLSRLANLSDRMYAQRNQAIYA